MRPRMLVRFAHRYAIVASAYNQKYVEGMVAKAEEELREIEKGVTVERFETPGAFEIPIVVQALAKQHRHDAIIALAVIIQGETDHARLIATSVTDALMRISLETGVPVIHEVLLLKNEQQAIKRCLESEINRGIEAARAAAGAAHVLRQIVHGK